MISSDSQLFNNTHNAQLIMCNNTSFLGNTLADGAQSQQQRVLAEMELFVFEIQQYRVYSNE
jgi:hypothetical protein